jgi:outer membrane immunogenic protein
MSADLPPLYKAPPVQLYSWSGCYFGGQLGQMWARQDWTDRMGPPAFGRSSGNLDATGFVGGVQGGCNYQTGPIVFGVQGDYLWANARGVGYAWDRFLGYVKGGGARQRTEYEFFIPATSGTLSGARETHAGWPLGIGAEYAFLPNVTAFIEYDYYDFGTRSTQFVTVVSVLDRMADIRERTSVVKGGVNFKFDLGAAAFNF